MRAERASNSARRVASSFGVFGIEPPFSENLDDSQPIPLVSTSDLFWYFIVCKCADGAAFELVICHTVRPAAATANRAPTAVATTKSVSMLCNAFNAAFSSADFLAAAEFLYMRSRYCLGM